MTRCIAIVDHRRCPHRTLKRNGDLHVCGKHGLITMALIDDMLSPQTRTMLARSSWTTAAEGQRLIDRRFRRRAA